MLTRLLRAVTIETENYLGTLARKSFLRLWSYQSPFKDQGKKNWADGREIVDLMVVFGDDIILFSDKNCEYPSHANPETAWKRWYSRAIQESAHQLYRAEGWLRKHPDRVFSDKQCKQRLPFSMPANPRFHLVVVAHDPTGRRAAALPSSTGSLMVTSEQVSDEAIFTVGDLDPNRPYVHVLDETNLSKILGHLNTTSDFLAYLRSKERFMRSGKRVLAAGEEELLAYYLTHFSDENNKHDFVIPKEVTGLFIEDGCWDEFVSSPQYKSYVESNAPSFLIDDMIDRFTDNALNGTLQFPELTQPVSELEIALRTLASESRLGRRLLAEGLYGILVSTKHPHFRILMPTSLSKTVYVLFVCKQLPDEDEKSYRMRRLMALASYIEWQCGITISAGSQVVGLAVNYGAHVRSGFVSWDLFYAPSLEVSAERREEIRPLATELQWGLHQVPQAINFSEYPKLPAFQRKSKIGRNERCPCGSGKKYKKCCLRSDELAKL